jgi:hypothetical protein
MLSDLRVILGGNAGARRTEARGIGGTISIQRDGMADEIRRHGETDFHRSAPDQGADREKNHRAHDAAVVPDPRHTTVAVESTFSTGVSREGMALGSQAKRGGAESTFDNGRMKSLSRKAEAARNKMPNW